MLPKKHNARRGLALLGLLALMLPALAACGGETPTVTTLPVATNTTVVGAGATAAATDTTSASTPTEAGAATPSAAAAAGTPAGGGAAGGPTVPPQKVGGGGTIRWSNEGVQDLDTLDPAGANASNSIMAMSLIFEGLVRLDSKLNIQPAGASSWDISPDGKTYTFHIRPGLAWADGSLVTAEDFRWSIERALSKDNSGRLRQLLPEQHRRRA